MINKLRHTRSIVRIKTFLQNFHLWNTTVTVYHVLQILWNKIIQFDIDVRAAAVAYSFTLAVFPTIIFLFSLLPYIPINHLDLKIITFLQGAIPEGLDSQAAELVTEIVSKPHGGVLSLGFFLALYASTSGIMALMKSFNLTYKTDENRGFIKARLIAVMMNFLLTVVLVVAIMVLIVGRFVIDGLFERGYLNLNFTYYVLKGITYLVVFAVFFVTISIIYYWAPAIHRKWNFVNVGSVTASILTICVTNLFSYYLSNFATYNKLYGSIGTIIALMVWLYLIALILIIGFEINASIDHALNGFDQKKSSSGKKS
ncbi:membrane protein [Pseudarcicella hirudinis]|uniref:Membrane protein n=1 Tax=Pseudarcicella hirudinis TaxID=1079859 RepID=A0A1I5SS76_9BACT|nr:YihY/virulence factor BrkB family protein [Pseudarcicella hirudinis]SFP73589.1 membrane protein [Pseudarcicella hirudinis]